ncbi:MAG: hypothetical protein LBE13_10125 [Bacteroidales bacterium]|jgi:hypothetical protein|nr:hypothetical protein [Bacteroidales bacterium]
MEIKIFKLLSGVLCIVILISLLLSGIKEQRRPIIKKNVKRSSIVFGGTSAFSSIYASKIKYECTFEAVISEAEFIKYCQQNNWAIESFCNTDKPLKIRRYNWIESIDKYKHEEENLNIDQENDCSCIHFVKKGYQYNNLHGEKKSEGLRIFIVYDKSNGKVYAYYRNR